MKKYLYILSIPAIVLTIVFSYQACSVTRFISPVVTDTLVLNPTGKGNEITFDFRKGSEHNHPVMAIWLTDTADNYIQTLYVAQSVGKGTFEHGDKSGGTWKPGSIRRPAALPVWAHNRGIKAPDGLYTPSPENPVPDAYTGATPSANFHIETRSDSLLPQTIYIYFEINQTWDWNQYWNNNKYPNDTEYKTSCQPALVYRATAFYKNVWVISPFELIGHSHYNGSNGEITPDISTITTAKQIVGEIEITIR